MQLSGSQLVAAADVFGDAVALLDGLSPSGSWRVLSASSQFRAHLGGRPDLFAMLAEDQVTLDMVAQAALSRLALSVEVQLDRAVPPYPVAFVPLPDGTWLVRLGSNGSFSESLRERALLAERAANLANEVPIGLLYCAHGVRCQWANAQAAAMLGLQGGDMAGLGWLSSMSEGSRAEVAAAAIELADGGEQSSLTAALATADGERHVVLRFAGGESGYVVTVEDVSAQVVENRKLHDNARRDALTQLANRAGLSEALDAMISSCPDGGRVAALFLDLDGFKAVNDTYGHPAGDRLLIEVARRLEKFVRPGDVASRLSGDEFVVALDKITSPAAACGVAQRILDAVSAPVDIDGQAVLVTPSIGIALTSSAGATDLLIKEADAAMYRAKRAGKACYVLAD